jgi:hypothetical protein
MLSSNAQFTFISAVTVSPDGVLNVADQGSLHILALEHYLPTPDENGEFRCVPFLIYRHVSFHAYHKGMWVAGWAPELV